MDKSRFSQAKTGRLVRITEPLEDWAFVPDPLPPSWKPDHKLFRLLADAMVELGRLDGAGRVAANPDLLLRPLRRREALKSSSLEGTHATAQELLLFEAETRTENPDAVREVANYAAALELGIQLLAEIPYCLRLISQMHERLTKGVRGREKRPGQFRQTQVHIGSDRRYVPPPPAELNQSLQALERSLHHRPPEIHPLLWCFIVHYQFEAIHPFNDGNGRVGRLLLALMTATECGLARPWLYMSPWFDRYKDEYIDLMFRVSTHGDWSAWLDFCVRGAIAQAKDANARLDALIALQQDYVARVAASGGSARLGAIVDGLFTISPLTTVPNLQRFLNVSYPTAKSDLERLMGLGIVKRWEDTHPKRYVAWDIVKVGLDETPD